MATILLSAAGGAVGASIGGSVLGISAAVAGRAVGATIGRVIDSKLLGAGSPAVETGRVDRFRISGASEGAPIAHVHGRVRVSGQVIWASQFLESSTTTGGGKGAPSQPKTTSYSYSVSLAIALCEGEVSRVGRIWADGTEISKADVTMRFYPGSATQLPDPKIEAIEGLGEAPAYRGTSYVVFENLQLGPFGNRVPQFSFEVMRTGEGDPADHIRALALIPGTGEYALATTPVLYSEGPGLNTYANVNTASGEADILTALDSLAEEAPNCTATSLIVSWFGDDLRCGNCQIRPLVEQTATDGVGMPWEVSGIARASASQVPTEDGRPIYGGTPADASVLEAIAALKNIGQDVMFYPFVLMTQTEGNTLTDPWTGDTGQPSLPWRGRVTTSLAPNVPNSPDGTAAAIAEVSDFFGTATASDFVVDGDRVLFTGADGFTYRRFILHYAHLCAIAGGVDAFCIGSEMRGLTQIRGGNDSFPAVHELIDLAAEVRDILGANTKISYAADWTEYFGYQPLDGSGNVYFHLDPLWSDDNIDFVGIDNYMPLSDWRDGIDHVDSEWGSIYNVEYLKSNIEGGEGYDWYYKSASAEALQIRSDITDGAYQEPWVYRFKDIRGWWENAHYDRVGGVRSPTTTEWIPGSKPIWFCEIGCAAIDKGTNQPNKFLDPKSSESSLPKYSTGARDDLMQMQYLRAITEYWNDSEKNPVSNSYSGRMIDTNRMFVWAWDARPYPNFPGNSEVWSDGDNYSRGHWLSGRISARSLAGVVSEICQHAGIEDFDVSELYGLVRGFHLDGSETPRALLQSLMLATGVDATEKNGVLTFKNRTGRPLLQLTTSELAEVDGSAYVKQARDPLIDVPDKVRLNFLEADGDYEIRAEESAFPDTNAQTVSQSELSLVLTEGEGIAATERWLSETRVARDKAVFALPPSSPIQAGDTIELQTDEAAGVFRIDRLEDAGLLIAEAVRVDAGIYEKPTIPEATPTVPTIQTPVPVWPVIMDLPLLTGRENEIAPWVAATAKPWPGGVHIYGSSDAASWGYELVLERSAVIGETLNDLASARPGIWDRGEALTIRIPNGDLSSISEASVFANGNAAVIGDPVSDVWEVFQFRDAQLVGPDTWALSMRLRGQKGTDGLIPNVWPAGSVFVLLDENLRQIQIASSQRDVERHYRIGPASKAVDHSSYLQLSHTASAAGLRPYAPVHLRVSNDGSGNFLVKWLRQSRIDGDLWSNTDIPLGEQSEEYLVRITAGGATRREVSISSPSWTYLAADVLQDGLTGNFEIHVAQVSDRFGPGLFAKVNAYV